MRIINIEKRLSSGVLLLQRQLQSDAGVFNSSGDHGLFGESHLRSTAMTGPKSWWVGVESISTDLVFGPMLGGAKTLRSSYTASITRGVRTHVTSSRATIEQTHVGISSVRAGIVSDVLSETGLSSPAVPPTVFQSRVALP